MRKINFALGLVSKAPFPSVGAKESEKTLLRCVRPCERGVKSPRSELHALRVQMLAPEKRKKESENRFHAELQ